MTKSKSDYFVYGQMQLSETYADVDQTTTLLMKQNNNHISSHDDDDDANNTNNTIVSVNNTTDQKPISTYSVFSVLYSLYGLVSNIGYTFKEKIFPQQYEFLEQAEHQIYRCVKTKLYHYYVEIENDVKIWTTSSIPKDIMLQYKNNELDNVQIRLFNLDRLPVLMIHGFCAGSGFWSMNMDHICETDTPIFAIDMPGFAHSSRIPFPTDGQETEDVFLTSFEQWRIEMGLGKLIIIGHSMGGFLTSAYALKHPDNVQSIILVDTWGYPDLKETVTNVIQKESSSVVGYHLVNRQGWFRVLMFLFKPFSPFAMLRSFGSVFGPKIIHKIRPQFAQRYSRVYGEDDYITINNYIYSINSFCPTGEEAFRSLAHPLGWAKNPILRRIHKLPSWISVNFIYGSRSWITSESGFDTKEILKDNKVKVYVVDNAGHHIYADQPEIFGRLLQKIIKKHNTPREIFHLEEEAEEESSPYFAKSSALGYKTEVHELRTSFNYSLDDDKVIW